MGKDQIKDVSMRPFVKTSWIIQEVLVGSKKGFSIFLRTLYHIN